MLKSNDDVLAELRAMRQRQEFIVAELKKIEDLEPPEGKTRFDLMIELIEKMEKDGI